MQITVAEYLKIAKKRLWPRVNRGTGCWEWTGPPAGNGRGQINVRGKPMGVHRLAWIASRKSLIPHGLHVLHTCDNPVCVRPTHLFLGTAMDNCQDKIGKGRMRHGHLYGDEHPLRKNPELAKRGSQHGRSKLTEEQVLLIRELMAKNCDRRGVAEYFGITPSTVSAIVTRRIWRHI